MTTASIEEILKKLTTMLAHIDGIFEQVQTQVNQINARIDELVQQRHQQNPVEGGGQVDQDRGVDEAINAGDDGTKDDDHQDAVSVKSEIDSDSCHCEFDDWLKEEEITVKKEEVVEDSGTGGQQQPEDQTIFQPMAGPSGMCRSAPKRPQANPPRRSPRLGTSQCPLNLAESSSDDETESDSTSSPSPTKKARTATSKVCKRHLCPHCSRMVTNLDVHLLTHTKQRPHLCDHCSKAFTRSSHLTEHRRIHTGERPYVCQYTNCGRAFTKKSNLMDHLRRHLGKKRYRCEHCGKRFVTSSSLSSHRRTVHSRK